VTVLALIADGPGSIGSTVTSLLAVGAFAAGWVAVRRLLNKGFPRIPRWGAWVRPSSTAHLTILTPRPGEMFQGDPARVPITLRLTGAHIVTFTSTDLRPDEGHIHLFIDGRLVSMTYGLSQKVWVAPGDHTLMAAFVAVDHAPFNPPVETSVPFRVTP